MIDIDALPAATGADIVYAIGDIHGRLDLLLDIERAVEEDVAAHPDARPLVCYLGDYIDRGPSSAAVIGHLAAARPDGVQRVFLKGNHEERMLAFLDAPAEHGPGWLKFGGREALESYGLSAADIDSGDWPLLRDRLRQALPPAHLAFLEGLDLAFRWGGYLFVHAGLNPTRTLADQEAQDLMRIREPFLSSECDWGLRVVHGHVITPEPVFRPNRIGLDTGAYASGVLTCAAIDADQIRILQTGT